MAQKGFKKFLTTCVLVIFITLNLFGCSIYLEHMWVFDGYCLSIKTPKPIRII